MAPSALNRTVENRLKAFRYENLESPHGPRPRRLQLRQAPQGRYDSERPSKPGGLDQEPSPFKINPPEPEHLARPFEAFIIQDVSLWR